MRKIWLFWGALLVSLNIMAPPEVRAADVPAVSQRLIDFSIDAAPLALAVRTFALKAGISVSYEPATVRGKQSRRLVGRFSPGAGLRLLLEGTAIIAVEQANGDYVLRTPEESGAGAKSDSAKLSLPPVTVQEIGSSAFISQAAVSFKLTAADDETPRTTVIIAPEIIKETNALSLVDALRTVPGVTFRGADASGTPASDRPFVRGFDAANSVLVDGLRSSGPQGRELFAVEQVEVMEGPASVYSGRGAGGGSINLVSKVAKNKNTFSTTSGIGTSAFVRQTVDVNRILDGDAAARLNLMWQDGAKAGREVVTNTRWGVAPTVTFGMTSPTKLTLSYYHLQSDEVPDYSVPYQWGGGAPLSFGDTPFYGLLSRDYLHTTTDTVQADYRQRLYSDVVLRSLTQYSKVQQSFVATNPQFSGPAGDVLSLQAKSGLIDMSSFTNQTELSGSWGRSDWIAGIELSRENGKRASYDVRDAAGNSLANGATCSVPLNCTTLQEWTPNALWTGSVGPPPRANTVLTQTDSAALYLLDTVQVNEKWFVNVGGRYDYFRTATDGATRLGATEGMLNYQLGVVYKPGELSNVYASLSTSSNPVGADAGVGADSITVVNQDVMPERVRNLEVGIKRENSERTLSATLAVFRSQKSHARISVSRDTITGAEQSIQGVEASLRGSITPSWKVFAGLAYLNSVIDDGGTVPAFSGNSFPMVPRRSAALWISYKLLSRATAAVGVTYSDRIFANASNTNYVPAYTKYDAMLAYSVDEHLELQLNLFNITNKRYYDVAYPVYATIAPARSAVLTARLKF